MNIKSSIPVVRPTQNKLFSSHQETSQTQENIYSPTESFQSSEKTLSGPLSRAVYGAALYGLPAVAGATMGINGLLPGAVVGAGLGAATHLESTQRSAIFAATGAVVGAAGGYIGFLGASYGFKLPAIFVAAALGAGTQALFSLRHES